LQEYVSLAGTNHFLKWLNNLRDIRARAKIRVRLNRIRLGNFGDTKSVGNGVFELRIQYGPGYWVYFAKVNNVIVLLLCGGTKSMQNKDINHAKLYWEDYQRRIS
jgi:putative addiction module killer protein